MLRRRRHLVLSLLLLAAVGIGFCTVLSNGFVNLDDPQYVTENPYVLGGLSGDGLVWAFTTYDAANWHPLTWLSLQLDSQFFWPKRPWGYHLTSLLLHGANAVLLFLTLQRMTGAAWRCFFVAALFAVHPLRVESVAWVAERKDVLSMFFGLLAMYAYARYAERPRWPRFLPVALFFALSLLAKPMLVTLPCVLLLLDYWPLNRSSVGRRQSKGGDQRSALSNRFADSWRRWWPLLQEKLPLFAIAALSSWITVLAQSHGGAVTDLDDLTLSERVANALAAYVQYLGKTFWPANLGVFYPHPRGHLSIVLALSNACLLALVSVLAFRAARRGCQYLLIGWLWYLGTLVPMIGLVQVGTQGMADRYTYFPLIGVSVMLVWGLPDLLSRCKISMQVPIWLGAAVVIACGALTWRQVGHWHDSRSLWQHTLTVTQNNYRAHLALARELEREGNLKAAIPHYARAVQINPFSPFVQQAHGHLANILFEQGKVEEAESEFRAILSSNPSYALARANLGSLLLAQKRWFEGIEQLAEAARLEPDNKRIRQRLAQALDAANLQAWVLATSKVSQARSGAQALELARRLCAVSENRQPLYLATLAAAHAEVGDFVGAAGIARNARLLAAQTGQAELALRLENHIQSYDRRQPLRN